MDIDEKTRRPLLMIDQNISRHLKPHQIEGIKFMWESCFEKLSMVKSGHKGSGCLLAHCMGLGKTLQVIALIHTLLVHKKETGMNRIMIMLPVNVQANWRDEINKWTKSCQQKIRVYELPMNRGQDKDLNQARVFELKKWYTGGGVLLIGYKLFALMVEGKNVKPKKLMDEINTYLLSPGADLIICDEGHMLKNDKSNLSKAVSQIETQRRIVLTGTPLQNNLIEYHCMVSFVKPNLLGNIKEFKNR